MPHPHEEVLRNFYDALFRGDVREGRADDLLAPAVVLHATGRNPLAGDYVGREELRRYLATLIERSERTFGFRVHDVLANDEHGVVLVKLLGERDGKELDLSVVHVWHFDQGKPAECWLHPADQYALDDFWS